MDEAINSPAITSMTGPLVQISSKTVCGHYRPGATSEYSVCIRSFSDLFEIQLEFVPLTENLFNLFVDLAFKRGTMLYDSNYLGIVKGMEFKVVTADKRFYSKCSKLKEISLD